MAAPPASSPPPASDPNPNPKPEAKRKPEHKAKPSNPSALNPNWAQLQDKLRHHSTTLLGKRKNRDSGRVPPPPPLPAEAEAAVLAPTSDDTSLTRAVALDCKMVGVGAEGTKSTLGSVTLVNSRGNVVYDEHVHPVEWIVDFRTHISGIRPRHMKKG